MKVSLITAVYNNKDHILDAINSVASQTGIDLEYIVIDGGSTDGTQEIIAANMHKIDKYVSGRDGGIYEALNKGLSIATGDYVGYLHSDDFFNSTTTLFKLISSAPKDADLIYGDLDFVDRDDKSRVVRKWRSCTFHPKLLNKGWMPPHPTLYVRRSVLNQIGGFDTQYRICADYDCILKLFSIPGVITHYSNEVIVMMRTGGASNNSIRNAWRKYQENRTILNRNGFNGSIVAFLKIVGKVHQFL